MVIWQSSTCKNWLMARRHLEPYIQDGMLALQVDVVWPLNELGQVQLGYLCDARVLGPLPKKGVHHLLGLLLESPFFVTLPWEEE